MNNHIRFIVLLLLTSYVAFGVARVNKSSETQPIASPAPSSIETSHVELAQVMQLQRRSDSLIIDARPEARYRLAHIARAINIEASTDDATIAKRLAPFRGFSNFIVYCESEPAICQDATRVADMLSKALATPVLIYRGGYSEWVSCGLPTDKDI